MVGSISINLTRNTSALTLNLGRHLAHHIYMYEAASISSTVIVFLVPLSGIIPAPGYTMSICQWIAIYVELLILILAIFAYATIAQVKANRERTRKAAAEVKTEPKQPNRSYVTTVSITEVEENEEV